MTVSELHRNISVAEVKESVIPFSIAIVLLVCLLTMYCYKLYQDLYTKERKSVAHRNKNPQITRTYRIQQQLIAIPILFYFLSMVGALTAAFQHDNAPFYWGMLWCTAMLTVAKTCQYTVFMLRLHNIYGASHFAYSKWQMITVVIVGFIGTFIFAAEWLVHIVLGKHTITYQAEDETGPILDVPIIYNIPFVITELAVNVAAMMMFLSPLRKTQQDLARTLDDDTLQRKTQKMAFVGSKMFVLCATSSLTTLLTLASGPFPTVSPWLYGLNYVSDSICMILIAPYLTGNNHCLFTTLCRPSIYCCWGCGGKYSLLYVSFKEEPWKKEREMKSADSVGTKKTVDTMSAPRVYANEVNPADSPHHAPQVTPLPAISPEVTPAPPSHDDMQQLELQDVASDSAKDSQDLEVNKEKADEDPITPASE